MNKIEIKFKLDHTLSQYELDMLRTEVKCICKKYPFPNGLWIEVNEDFSNVVNTWFLKNNSKIEIIDENNYIIKIIINN